MQGDHLLATFTNADAQKSGADAIGALLGDGYTVAFKLEPTVPHWLSMIGAGPMPLGLDLQGGVHYVQKVYHNAAQDKRMDS